MFKHFVAFRGGTTRRNKAALTSKRSALKFSYLYIRDFDSEQKAKALAPFFDLALSDRLALLSAWKKVNSSLVEITPVMYQGLMRIVSKGGDDEPVVPIRRRQKELQDATTLRTDARPTRASTPVPDASTVLGKRKPPAAIRASSTPWSVAEMEQLLEAWTVAVEAVCANASNEPMSIMHEMYRHFASLQTGPTSRNLSGLATRRRVLKQSYSRIAAFDKMQELSGDVKFTDLPVATRLNVLRSWKNGNLLDLSADMYAKLHTIIALDTQAVALEDLRRTKGAGMKPGPVAAGRKGGRLVKQAKGTLLGLEDANDEGLYASQLPGMLDREDEKGTKGSECTMVKTVPETGTGTNDRPHFISTQEQVNRRPVDTMPHGKGEESVAAEASTAQEQAMASKEPSVAAIAPLPVPVRSVAADPVPGLATDKAQLPRPVPFMQARETYPTSVPVSQLHAKTALGTDVNDQAMDVITVEDSPVDDSPVEDSTLEEDPPVASRGVTSDDVEEVDAPVQKSPGRWGGKRKRKVHLDAPNGLLWDIHELAVLIQAWETAARRVCASDPTDRLSLNREMYREFVALQGGYSVRNDTALAARRSSLKSSYAHISSFNESQAAKGEPCYHALPEDTRMSLLRSWKNRNSVDLTLDMYEALGRIVAMDEKLAELRHLRLPMSPKGKSGVDAGDDGKGMKGPKWSTDESFDLIQACANVMNEAMDHAVAHRDRERLIFDAFVARRKSRGDTDTPIRRDLRSMAQQWRCILASYSYIKACNDDRSEPAWFDMTAVQKRAYQQCTNVPSKFVDLDAEMFALVTKTSFLGAASPIRPSPVADFASDGIALRPRSTRKKADVFWSSDSDASGPDEAVDDSRPGGGKKGTNWPPDELWRLIQAWEEAVETTKGTRLTAALHDTYALFTKRQRPLHRTRTLISVKNRMIALNSSYLGISAYIGERGDRQAWFALTPDERLQEIRRWGNKTILDLTQDMYEALARILTRKGSDKSDGSRRKQGRMKDGETRSGGTRPEKYAAANWSKKELLLLSEACGELLEGRRSRRYVFEEEKDRFFRRYEELGGKNSLVAAVGLARYVLDSYEFIYFYNQRATERTCLTWFELDLEDREAITTSMSKSYRNFNGLATVDEELYAVIDKLDAEIRRKLGEEKKKTYKPPSDASSSRYVDIESVIEYCEYKTRGEDGHVDEERPEDASEEAASSLADVSSDHDSIASEESEESAVGEADGVSTRRSSSARRGPDALDHARRLPRARSRDADAVDGSATLSITEIIHRQSRTFEAAVQQFRKESAVARKEHHAFLLQRIHETFPIDRGHGSFLERVAEGQSQALGELFQRLQHQRDVEKSQDDELMQQLFGSTVRM